MEVKQGEKYRHFKGFIVEIVCIARNSETLEDMVVYKHIKTNELWVRPLKMFVDQTDVSSRKDNKTGQKFRFEKIDD